MVVLLPLRCRTTRPSCESAQLRRGWSPICLVSSVPHQRTASVFARWSMCFRWKHQWMDALVRTSFVRVHDVTTFPRVILRIIKLSFFFCSRLFCVHGEWRKQLRFLLNVRHEPSIARNARKHLRISSGISWYLQTVGCRIMHDAARDRRVVDTWISHANRNRADVVAVRSQTKLYGTRNSYRLLGF